RRPDPRSRRQEDARHRVHPGRAHGRDRRQADRRRARARAGLALGAGNDDRPVRDLSPEFPPSPTTREDVVVAREATQTGQTTLHTSTRVLKIPPPARSYLVSSQRRFPYPSPYHLRHTFATEAVAAGVSIFELARVMGASVREIDRTYGHL